MAEFATSVAEAKAHFSTIASAVNASGKPVTVFKDSKPWVMIVPVDSARTPIVDWSVGAVPVNRSLGHAVLPVSWDAPEDEGLYDDLA